MQFQSVAGIPPENQYVFAKGSLFINACKYLRKLLVLVNYFNFAETLQTFPQTFSNSNIANLSRNF